MVNRLVSTLLIPLAVLLVACAPPDDSSGERSGADLKPPPTAGEHLLERMIAFHDPEGQWSSASLEVQLEESRPDGTLRNTRLEFHNGSSRARIDTERAGRTVSMVIDGESVGYEVDGASQVPSDVVEELRLGDEQILRMRNYYHYLYGLPMKLRDPGTIVAAEVEVGSFMSREVDTLRVTYDPQVGSDVWLFYADPQTAEMVGYRFFHDEAEGDGEYIVLEGLWEVDGTGLRLPRQRTWYTNQGDELLGTDTIVGAGTLATP